MKNAMLALLLTLPLSAVSFTIEKADNTTVTTNGDTETITIGARQYLLWQIPKSGFEVFASVPDKYSGPMQKLSPGDPISEEELGKVLEIHYKNSAFDFDSFKVRNLTNTGLRYVVFCLTDMPIGPACTHEFRAGSWIDLETNGKNRMGGMSGFEPASLLITKAQGGQAAPAVISEQPDGRAPRATPDELKRQLDAGVTIHSDRTPADVLAAARSVLTAEGYSVPATSNESTELYTDARDLKLDSKTADCGKVWGMQNIGDKRTETNILIAVTDHDGQVTVRSGVGGIMRISIPFGPTKNADKILSCHSNGIIEQDISAKISAKLQ